MNPEIVSTVLTGAGLFFGIWRMQAGYEARNEQAHAAIGKRVDILADRIGVLESRMASLEGEIRGFMAGFRAQPVSTPTV